MQNQLISTTSCLNSKGEPSPPTVSSPVTSALALKMMQSIRRCCLNLNDLFNALSALLIGYALDPSVDTHQVSTSGYIGAVDEAEKNKGNLSHHKSDFIQYAFSCMAYCLWMIQNDKI